jgi:hypothetical protein
MHGLNHEIPQTKLSPIDAQGMKLSRDRYRQMGKMRGLTAEVTFRTSSKSMIRLVSIRILS